MEQSKQYSPHTPSWQGSTHQAPTSLLPDLMQHLGLETLSSEPSLRKIRSDLSHPDWTVRAAAIQALSTKGTLTNSADLDMLLIALRDTDATVRAIACRIAGNQSDNTALDHLQAVVAHDPDWHVYETTLRALRNKQLVSSKATQKALHALNECVEEFSPARRDSNNKVLIFHSGSLQHKYYRIQPAMQGKAANIIPISEQVKWAASTQKATGIENFLDISLTKKVLAMIAVVVVLATWPFLGLKTQDAHLEAPLLMHNLAGNYASLAWLAGGLIVLRQIDNSKIRVLNPASNQLSQLQSYTVEQGRANETVALAPSNGYLSATAGHMLHVWNILTNNSILTYDDPTQYWQQTDWSPDGKYMTVLSRNGLADIWNVATKVRIQIENYKPTDRLSWSPLGDLLAKQSLSGQIQVISGGTGKVIQNIVDKTDSIHFFAWSPTGKRFATSGEHTTGVWNTLTGEKILTLPDALLTATWGNDERLLATTINMQTRESSIQLWDTNTGQVILNFSNTAPDGIYAPTFTPGGRMLITHSGTDTTKTWDTTTGKNIATYHISGIEKIYAQNQIFTPVTSGMALSPDGHYTAAPGANNSTLVWETRTGHPIYTYAYATQPKATATDTPPLAWSPDGQSLAVIGNDATVAVLQAPGYKAG